MAAMVTSLAVIDELVHKTSTARLPNFVYGVRDRQPNTRRLSKMDPEKLLAAISELVEGLRADMAKHGEEMTAKYDACMGEMKQMKADTAGMRRRKDEDGEDPTMATRTAADSIGATEFSVLRREVTDMKKAMARPIADLNAFADVQAKSDAVMRTHNLSAEPPMAGEDIVSYKIRQHRPMQKFSKRWKGVELKAIAGDSTALEGILTEIRADAMQAGLNPVDLPMFEHRKIVKQSPGGHTITEFVGTGTIFKMMSRPVRHVSYIGVRDHSRA
jgi:hypothetical protein